MYTCPTHTLIRQIEPGACGICGIALEPEIVSVEVQPNAELADMSRRFWVSLALALPVLALETGSHLTNLSTVLGQQTSNWLQFLLATPVVIWGGWPFYARGWRSFGTRNDVFTLIAIGAGVAWAYSVIAVTLPSAFPPAFRGEDGAVDIYFEVASVITVLALFGQLKGISGAGLAASDHQAR